MQLFFATLSVVVFGVRFCEVGGFVVGFRALEQVLRVLPSFPASIKSRWQARKVEVFWVDLPIGLTLSKLLIVEIVFLGDVGAEAIL